MLPNSDNFFLSKSLWLVNKENTHIKVVLVSLRRNVLNSNQHVFTAIISLKDKVTPVGFNKCLISVYNFSVIVRTFIPQQIDHKEKVLKVNLLWIRNDFFPGLEQTPLQWCGLKLMHVELTAAVNLISGKTDESVRSAIWFCAAIILVFYWAANRVPS